MEFAIIDVSILRVRLATLMRYLLCALLATARSSLRPQRELAIENLALRQQLAILKRTTKRPKLSHADRAFWVALCGLWSDWQNALLLVKPETGTRSMAQPSFLERMRWESNRSSPRRVPRGRVRTASA